MSSCFTFKDYRHGTVHTRPDGSRYEIELSVTYEPGITVADLLDIIAREHGIDDNISIALGKLGQVIPDDTPMDDRVFHTSRTRCIVMRPE